jgi:hypothetical protein
MFQSYQPEKVFSPTTSQELLPPATKEQRQANWRIMQQRFSKETDGTGTGMDTGIIEPVIGLSLLNINTVQSCEGHLDHGVAYPWIAVAAKPTPELEKLHQAEKELYEPSPSYTPDKLRAERARIHKEITALAREPNLAEARKLSPLLEEYYSQHSTPQEQPLTVTFGPRGDGRLQPQGTEIQENNVPATKEQILMKFRQEMAAFSAFLKNKYIGD